MTEPWCQLEIECVRQSHSRQCPVSYGRDENYASENQATLHLDLSDESLEGASFWGDGHDSGQPQLTGVVLPARMEPHCRDPIGLDGVVAVGKEGLHIVKARATGWVVAPGASGIRPI